MAWLPVNVNELLFSTRSTTAKLPSARGISAEAEVRPVSNATGIRDDAARMAWTSRQPRPSLASSISETTAVTFGAADEVPPKLSV